MAFCPTYRWRLHIYQDQCKFCSMLSVLHGTSQIQVWFFQDAWKAILGAIFYPMLFPHVVGIKMTFSNRNDWVSKSQSVSLQASYITQYQQLGIINNHQVFWKKGFFSSYLRKRYMIQNKQPICGSRPNRCTNNVH